MGFLRRSRAIPVRLRLQVSWWTSAGVVCLLLIAVLAMPWRQSQDMHHMMNTVSGLSEIDTWSPNERKLNTYPNDPIMEAEGDPRYSEAENKYWVFIHIILIGYMFLGLNTVCDIYFTGALEVMVDKWDIKPDVAGATFMAAGGSAPELFSSLIGACYLSNDVGFSTIVGSAVFNVLFVIGLCGAVVKEPIALTWWPLFRDCSYYIIGLIMLAIFAYTGNEIGLGEAIVLFIGYIIYCIIMYYSVNLESLAKTGSWRVKREGGGPTKPSQVAPITGEHLRDAAASEVSPGPPEHHKGAADLITTGNGQSSNKLVVPPVSMAQASSSESNEPQRTPRGSHLRTNHFAVHHSTAGTRRSADEGVDKVTAKDNEAQQDGQATDGDVDDEELEGSNAEDDVEELMVMPEGTVPRILWFIKLPIYGPLYYLTPKPDERKFVFTFLISLLWIGGYSYFLIWWVDVIVGMIALDLSVAGITVLAAGTSIPDLVSSMAVARAGEGDMAVSSSIGSNIFDILVGLPFPWMIKILLVETNPGYTIPILSPYIVIYVIILLFMVFCVILSIHLLNWKLNTCLGLCMAVLYGIFMVFALILEIGKPEWAKIG